MNPHVCDLVCDCCIMHSCTYEHLLWHCGSRDSKNDSLWISQVLLTMDSGKRNIGKYSFKDTKIDEWISLTPEIECSADFRKKYGSIIPLMKLKMKEGFLLTLIQFYDPVYHFFTFPDYQLMPTLEEYSYMWYGGRIDLGFCILCSQMFQFSKSRHRLFILSKGKVKKRRKDLWDCFWVRGVDYEKGRC